MLRLEMMVVCREETEIQDRNFPYYHRRAVAGCKTRAFQSGHFLALGLHYRRDLDNRVLFAAR